MLKIFLIVYDNGSYVNWFPHGLSYISSYLKEHGHQVDIYNQDIYHWPSEHLTQTLDNNNYHVVCVGVIGGYYQYRKLLEISKAIENSKKSPVYIIGGHGPSPEPKYFLEKTKADYVVIGEGEETICELLDCSKDIDEIDRIAYFDANGKYNQTKSRTPIKTVDDILYPDWSAFPIDHYVLTRQPGFSSTDRLMPVLSARGCPYTCAFCYRMSKGFRARNVISVVEEIQKLQKDYNINAIDFSDELLMSGEKRTTKFCETLLDKNLNIKWSCNGRLNFASEKLLKLMKRAGCVFVNYGIECIDDKVLELMNKKLTVETIINGVENTNKVGIIPGLNIIFGSEGETKETLKKGVDFLKKYNQGGQLRTLRPVTPYPGSPLYYKAIEQGKLEGPEDFYENKHVNSDLLTVNFTNMSDEEFYTELHNANRILIEDYYHKSKTQAFVQCDNLYNNKNINFRGFRQI